MRILVCQLLARSLCPHHEGVHRPLYMRFVLQSSVPMRGNGNQWPVITLQDVRHRVADADWEALIFRAAPTLRRNDSREAHWVGVVFLSRRLGARSTLGQGRFIARTPCTVCQWLFCHFRGQSTNLSLKISCVNAHTRRNSGNPFLRTRNLPSLSRRPCTARQSLSSMTNTGTLFRTHVSPPLICYWRLQSRFPFSTKKKQRIPISV